jgi:hypothetical protein
MNDPAREILIAGAGALAHSDGLGPSLQVLLDSIATGLGLESAAIVVVKAPPAALEIAASFGLVGPALAGLAEAIRDPNHPIARTVGEPVATYDVRPTRPGGPALRTHLPLVVTRAGATTVLGVLALAHEDSIDAGLRPLLQAAAELAAVTIELHQPG